jgi:hypothetical protein
MTPSTPDVRNPQHIDPFEIASPGSSTALAGNSGAFVAASDRAPEEFSVTVERPDPAQAGAPGVANSMPPVGAPVFQSWELIVPGMIVDEFLALCLDEGQNSSNAWRLHDHIEHGLDNLVKRVEGVLLRARVVEPELAEVGQ